MPKKMTRSDAASLRHRWRTQWDDKTRGITDSWTDFLVSEGLISIVEPPEVRRWLEYEIAHNEREWDRRLREER